MCDVLVLDDDDGVRVTLAAVLEMEGWTVREARDPADALAILSVPGACKLLVTDINLGTPQDGFAVADQARSLLPDMPVIYVSGRPWIFAEHHLAQDERALAKPFRSEELTDAVRELLHHTVH
ncbi:response regulator [Roseomonas sp. BN140053]|uniref:response regulator n=1 Tax=Roseomonas sp. BN140053 TaxID=3391898 RepID=UPI0039E9E8DF